MRRRRAALWFAEEPATATPARKSHIGHTLQLGHASIALGSGGRNLTVVLTAVARESYWRVKIAWPNKPLHFFGKFSSLAEAEKWIAEHRWLTDQRTNIIIAGADDPEDTSDR